MQALTVHLRGRGKLKVAQFITKIASKNVFVLNFVNVDNL